MKIKDPEERVEIVNAGEYIIILRWSNTALVQMTSVKLYCWNRRPL